MRQLPAREQQSLRGVLIVLCLGALACGNQGEASSPVFGATTPILSILAVNAPSSSIAFGGTVQLDATPRDQKGNVIEATMTWSSLNDTVAKVNEAGLVTGMKVGNVTISATASVGGVRLVRSIAVDVIPPFAGPSSPGNVLVNDPRRATFQQFAQFETSVAVSGSRVVVGWNDEIVGGKTIRGFNWSVGHGYSTDGGLTFHDAGEVGSSRWGADPTVVTDRAGNFYIARIDLLSDDALGNNSPDRIAIYKSTDGGVTFPQSASVTGNTAGRFTGVNDKPTITSDETGGAFGGNLYVSWTYASSNVLTVRFARSTDGGATFSDPIVLSDGSNDQGSVPVVGPRGEVYVFWTDRVSEVIFVRKSIDGGVTFGQATSVASAAPIGTRAGATDQYCGRVLNGSIAAGASSMIAAADRSGGSHGGALYVVFSTRGEGIDLADVFLTTSSDGGTTWSKPRRLNDDVTTNDQWQPFVAVAPNGAVGVTWYDRRQDPRNLLIDVFMRISTDGGASFGQSLKLTNVSFPPPGLNYKLGFPPYSCYMGSYNYMAAAAGNFYVVWTDNRMVTNGVADPNIMFAKVPY